MGQIAEDMVAGLACSQCGVYFVEEHGYPVLCQECWKYSSEEERQSTPELQRATREEM